MPGVTGPGDVTLVRHPPGAIAVGELAAGTIDRGVAVGDGVVRHLPAEAVPGDRPHRLLANATGIQGGADPVREHEHGSGLQVGRITDQIEVDDVLNVDVILDGEAAQLGVLLDLDEDAVHRRDHQSLALDHAGQVGDVVGPPEGVHSEPEAAGNVLHRIARLDRVVGNVAPHRGVNAGGAHLHDEPALADHHIVDVRGAQGDRGGGICAVGGVSVESVEGCQYRDHGRR